MYSEIIMSSYALYLYLYYKVADWSYVFLAYVFPFVRFKVSVYDYALNALQFTVVTSIYCYFSVVAHQDSFSIVIHYMYSKWIVVVATIASCNA